MKCLRFAELANSQRLVHQLISKYLHSLSTPGKSFCCFRKKSNFSQSHARRQKLSIQGYSRLSLALLTVMGCRHLPTKGEGNNLNNFRIKKNTHNFCTALCNTVSQLDFNWMGHLNMVLIIGVRRIKVCMIDRVIDWLSGMEWLNGIECKDHIKVFFLWS